MEACKPKTAYICKLDAKLPYELCPICGLATIPCLCQFQTEQINGGFSFWKRTIQLGTRKSFRDNLIHCPHFTDGALKVIQRCEVICPASKLTSEFEGKEIKNAQPPNSSIPHHGLTLLAQKLSLA